LAGAGPVIEVEERSGVPVLWSEAPGPVRVGLVFRVGWADESLSRCGTTHVVEHLAMAAVGRTLFWSNAWVEATRTSFVAEGTLEEAIGYVGDVTRGLRELPVERLDIERGVLASEADGSWPGPYRRLLHMRFGAARHGLGIYREFGLRAMEAEDALAWARSRFTAGNAALWMTARPPGDLELSLPRGERRVPPRPEPIAGLPLPSQHAGDSGEVLMAFVSGRSAALLATGMIAANRIEDRLRMSQGISYEIDYDYEPLDADLAHLMLTADCHDANAVAVRDGMQSVLDDLGRHGPGEDELARVVAMSARAEPDRVREFLERAALDHLSGCPIEQPGRFLEERRSLTPADVADAVRQALSTQLVAMPEAAAAARGRFVEKGPAPPTAVGKVYRARRERWRRNPRTLVLGSEGLTAVPPDQDPTTVRFEDCVAVIADAPGSYSAVGRDASTVGFAPPDLVGGDELLAALRDRLPAEVFVPPAPNVAALGALAAELPRPQRIGAEMEELPGELGPAEMPLALAEARRGRKLGALLATNQRLIWMYSGPASETVQFPWEAITALRPARWGAVVVDGTGSTLKLTRVRPRSAAAGIRRAHNPTPPT
jgi:hypothetical protein